MFNYEIDVWCWKTYVKCFGNICSKVISQETEVILISDVQAKMCNNCNNAIVYMHLFFTHIRSDVTLQMPY